MLLQIITYILIGLVGITNLWIGYERHKLYQNNVFATARWPRFAVIEKALADTQHKAWHPRLRRLKLLLLVSWSLVGCIAMFIILQFITPIA